jgi:hypothetical protein
MLALYQIGISALLRRNPWTHRLPDKYTRFVKSTPGRDGRCNTDRSECIVCAEEKRELSLPAATGGLKTMGYGRMAMAEWLRTDRTVCCPAAIVHQGVMSYKD